MSDETRNERALEGSGPRPDDPYIRIMWAAKRGHGVMLDAADVLRLSMDDAIATHAAFQATKR